jgi:hypothetical protein
MGTDYPETITVTVTQEHIDAGEPGDARNCPVALAFKGALAALGIDAEHAWVYGYAGIHDSEEEAYTTDAYEWQEDYDAGEPVQPATFTFTRVELS